MELIDDWTTLASPARPSSQAASGAARPLAERIQDELAGFEPAILSLHCYEDVRFPWVQLVFNQLITPDVALRAGDALARVLGPDQVCFNSLRPRAVYFLLDQPLKQASDLPIERYGERWSALRQAWASARPKGRPG